MTCTASSADAEREWSLWSSSVDRKIAAIADAGAFGQGSRFVSFERDRDVCGQDQYMSTVTFGTVVTSDGSRHPVVIKSKLRDPAMRETYKSDLHFHNEIAMYRTIIPFLQRLRTADGPPLPPFYYGRNETSVKTKNDSSIIVLENVKHLGFRLSENRLFLDYDHLVIALQAIAKFHGLSYTAKHRDPVGFHEIIAEVRDTIWDARGEWIMQSEDAIQKLGRRGVNRLLERNGNRYRDDEHLRRFDSLIEDGYGSLRRTLRTCEPLSVLCHGDFCRNNMLYRYDDNSRPVEALLFDFATPRYGSPALDLSFFLYLNTDRRLRDAHWDDLLDAYCSALSTAVPGDVSVPDRADVDAEMAACAFFGFAYVSFFLPYQLYVVFDDDPDPMAILTDLKVDTFLQLGGDMATEYVADMVQHIVDMGYTNV